VESGLKIASSGHRLWWQAIYRPACRLYTTQAANCGNPDLQLRLVSVPVAVVFTARGAWVWTYRNATWSTGLSDELQAVFRVIHECPEDGKCWWRGSWLLPKHGEDGWKFCGTDSLVCSSFLLLLHLNLQLVYYWPAYT